MSHPLIGNLDAMSLEELNTKFNDLSKKMSMAYRMGKDDVIMQMQIIMQDYQYEIARRNEKALAEVMDKTAEFKNIIDIN